MLDDLARELDELIVAPVLRGSIYDRPAARRMLVAVALQESAGCHLLQHGQRGPMTKYARGLWQFERIGIKGLAEHRAALRCIDQLNPLLGVELRTDPERLWRRQTWRPDWSAVLARALLWTYPAPLPDNESEGWTQYTALWRPGKPNRTRWHEAWKAVGILSDAATDSDPRSDR